MQLKLVLSFVLVLGMGVSRQCLFAQEPGQSPNHSQPPRELPPYDEVRKVVDQHFSDRSHLRAGDLICQDDVRSLFPILEALGWDIEDRQEILKKMLPGNDPLVGILRGSAGDKFMHQVSKDKLIYDRLDRIVREPGGERLLADLVKLPNAARYAKQKTGPGVPDLVDFLPKDRSGKTRRVKDYDKPTERIYTAAEFKKALQASYDESAHRARS